jgi:drug/metabolite transporter (DMT)-like permease
MAGALAIRLEDFAIPPTTPPAAAPASTDNLRGIAFMSAAMLVFIVNDTAVKVAAQSLSVGQIVFLRGLMSSAIAIGIVAAQGGLGELRHVLRPLVLARCMLEGLTAIAYIAALSLLPISTVTAVFLSSPLMITVVAAIWLGERVRWRRWLAVGVGFVGMLIVVRPSQDGLNAGVLLVLLATLMVVARDLITRRIPKDVSSMAVTVGTILAATATGGVVSLGQNWQPIGADAVLPLVIAAVAVMVGNYAIIVAFRTGEVSAVSPFRYTLMVWAVIAGLIVFGHWPDPVTWIGIVLIVAAGLYTLYREARVARGAG